MLHLTDAFQYQIYSEVTFRCRNGRTPFDFEMIAQQHPSYQNNGISTAVSRQHPEPRITEHCHGNILTFGLMLQQ